MILAGLGAPAPALADDAGHRLSHACLVAGGMHEYRCEPGAGTTRCALGAGVFASFHGEPAEAAMVDLDAGVLVASSVHLGESGFATVVGRLRALLADPEDHTERLRGGMGGTFDNAVWVWRVDGMVVFAEQFDGRITRSGVSCMTPTAFAELAAGRARQRSNGSRDL